MCGIAGLFDPATTPSRDRLSKMNECQAHRGPDAAATFRDGPIGLAHRRLSIIDLETGDQPMFNEDESVVLVFNGEIYNYRDLRARLREDGHRFRSNSDTEVIVHLYEEHGTELVEHIEGMFAFALWDRDREQLFLARDRLGIKPLSFARAGERIAFASEIGTLLDSGIPMGDLDERALSLYFAFGYIPAPHAIFGNVSKLRPGELAIVSADGVSRRSYYDLPVTETSIGFDRAAERLRNLVDTSVASRLQSDVPLGAFLSGGIDSSVIVGTMARECDEPVRTFTVGFEQASFDESAAARRVADFHDTDHTEVTVTAADVRSMIPEVLDRLGEPFADQSLLPSYVVARETGRDVTVALSGDGADELFAGYDKYRVESLSGLYRAVPQPIRGALLGPLVNTFPASRSSRIGTLVYQAQWFVNRAGRADVGDRHFDLMRIPDDSVISRLPDEVAEAGRGEIGQYHDKLALADRDALSRIQTADVRCSLPNQMLRKVDLASMYNSLEVRVPFLDTAVVEFANALPTEYKMTRRKRKRVLLHAFEDRLPRQTIERDKQGFDMPIGSWLADELADDFTEAVVKADIGPIDQGTLMDIYDEHASGRREHGKFLWSVYVYARWASRMADQGVLPAGS